MTRATLYSAWILTLVFTAACRSTGPSASQADGAAASRTPAMHPIEDFYRNTQFRGAAWSPRRDRILVSSNASGVWNAYAVAADGGAPLPLTASTTDSIFALSYFPADERFVYSSDQGGNELTHIFVKNPDGSTRDLTPGTKLKASFHGWAGDDRSLLVSTNERDPRYFDVYEIAVDGYTERRCTRTSTVTGSDQSPGTSASSRW